MTTLRAADDEVRDVLKRLVDPAVKDDPFPLLGWLRDNAPLSFSEKFGTYLLCRYDDCNRVLKDSENFRGIEESMWDELFPQARSHETYRVFIKSLVQADASEHARLRRSVSWAFTPRQIEKMRPEMERMTARFLDEAHEKLSSGETIEVHDEISLPLPLRVMGLLFGTPESDLLFLEGLIRRIQSVVDPNATPEAMADADAALQEFDDYLAALIAERQAAPRDDMLSGLITADKDRLSNEELRTMIITLWAGGYETTAIGIDNCVLTMLTQPEHAGLLRDYDTAFSFVDELLRWDSPAQISVKRRYAPEAVSFGDYTLPKGSQVRLLLGAANRDPRAYEDPDRFDPARTGPTSLAFGGGSHFCGGTLLARTEIAIVMNQLVHRLPGLRLAAEPVRMGSIHLRGFESFLVSLQP